MKSIMSIFTKVLLRILALRESDLYFSTIERKVFLFCMRLHYQKQYPELSKKDIDSLVTTTHYGFGKIYRMASCDYSGIPKIDKEGAMALLENTKFKIKFNKA